MKKKMQKIGKSSKIIHGKRSNEKMNCSSRKVRTLVLSVVEGVVGGQLRNCEEEHALAVSVDTFCCHP